MSVMLTHLFGVMTDQLHDNRCRDAGFFQKGHCGMPEAVKGKLIELAFGLPTLTCSLFFQGGSISETCFDKDGGELI